MTKTQLNFISMSLICLAALLLQPELESRLYGTRIKIPERVAVTESKNQNEGNEVVKNEPPINGGGVKAESTSDTIKPRLSLATINTMNAKELESINGVGPVLAKRIVEYRNANGPFKTVKDLGKVKGIGEKKLKAIEDQLSKEE